MVHLREVALGPLRCTTHICVFLGTIFNYLVECNHSDNIIFIITLAKKYFFVTIIVLITYHLGL